MSPLVRVLIGPPGSGKTTWCRHSGTLGTILSLDAARAVVGSGEHDQAATDAAVDYVRTRAHEALTAGRDVTIDATGARALPDRAIWLALAAEHHVEAHAVLFRTPLSTCLARNALRDRVVPSTVLTIMWLAIRDTTPEALRREGFTTVTTVPGGDALPTVDDRDWRYVAELQPPLTIWNPAPGPGAAETAVDVVAVSTPDVDGMITLTTTGSALVLAADWGVSLYTDDDTARITYLLAMEPSPQWPDR